MTTLHQKDAFGGLPALKGCVWGLGSRERAFTAQADRSLPLWEKSRVLSDTRKKPVCSELPAHPQPRDTRPVTEKRKPPHQGANVWLDIQIISHQSWAAASARRPRVVTPGFRSFLPGV